MVASGLEPKASLNHANDMIELAKEMLSDIQSLKNPVTGNQMKVKIGNLHFFCIILCLKILFNIIK
jgi:hypothetical protein